MAYVKPNLGNGSSSSGGSSLYDRCKSLNLNSDDYYNCYSEASAGRVWDRPTYSDDHRSSLPPVSKEAISKYFGTNDPEAINLYDLNADGQINIFDLVKWAGKSSSVPIDKFEFGKTLKKDQQLGKRTDSVYMVRVNSETSVFAQPYKSSPVGTLYPSSTNYDAYQALPSDSMGIQWLNLGKGYWVEWGSNVTVLERQVQKETVYPPRSQESIANYIDTQDQGAIAAYDVNQDGEVNIFDLVEWQNQQAPSVQPAVVTCPDGSPMTGQVCRCSNGMVVQWNNSQSLADNHAAIKKACAAEDARLDRMESEEEARIKKEQEDARMAAAKASEKLARQQAEELERRLAQEKSDAAEAQRLAQLAQAAKEEEARQKRLAEEAKKAKAKAEAERKATQERIEAERKLKERQAEEERLQQERNRLARERAELEKLKGQQQADLQAQAELRKLEAELVKQQAKAEKDLLAAEEKARQQALSLAKAQENEQAVIQKPVSSFSSLPIDPLYLAGGAVALGLLFTLNK
jgi:hypothetical protein